MTEPTKKTYYYLNGKIRCEEYWLNNKLHRTDGPAYISYYLSGQLKSERYWLNGKRHRTDGPAFIVYYENGRINREEYYLNGRLATKEQIQEIKFNQQFTKDLEEELNNFNRLDI